MKFKEARKHGVLLANEERLHWVYLYQTKDKEWWVSDCENFQSHNWYYLHRDGRILSHHLYEEWEYTAPVPSSKYPFSPLIPDSLYNQKGTTNED